jgi:hypothetical protein
MNFACMVQCQNETLTKYSLSELSKIRNEMITKLYQTKKISFKPYLNTQVLYDLISMEEKFSRFVDLIGRGLVLDFLVNDSENKTLLK